MRRRVGLIAAWVLATLVSIFIAGQAVSGVRNQVTDRPVVLPEITSTLAPTPAAAPAPTEVPGEAPPSAGPETTNASATTAAPADDPDGADPTNAAAPPPPTTTPPVETAAAPEPPPAPTEPGATTTSTTSTTSTTTTSAPTPLDYETHQLLGGWVRLAYRPGEVYLDGAGANPGFVVEAEQTGPDKVEVEFRSETHESELHAAWEDHGLDVQINESGES